MSDDPGDRLRDQMRQYDARNGKTPDVDLTHARRDSQKRASAATDETSRRTPKTPTKHTGPEVSSVSSVTVFGRCEPYVAFPVADLPAVVAQLVGEASASLGCDPSLLALPALAVCAAAIGKSRALRLSKTWTEPCVLWTVPVSESGTLKTPAYKIATDPLRQIQRRYIEAHAEAVGRYDAAKKQWEDNGSQGDEPVKPVMRRVLCSDVTIEKLSELLEDNPRGLLLTRDELSAWFGGFTRYKGKGGGSDAPHYLELYQCGSIVYDRKTGDRRTVIVDDAMASVTGCIQPGILSRLLTQEHHDSGLAARLLMAMPDRVKKRWRDDDVSDRALSDYDDLVGRLAILPMRDAGGRPAPDRLELSGPAKASWVRWYAEWAERQYDALPAQAATYSKIEGVAARLALLHHVCSEVAAGRDGTARVTADSMDAGIRLARWFARESGRIYSLLRLDDAQRETRELFEWVKKRGGSVSAKELQRQRGGKYPSADDARAALDALVKAGVAQWQTVLPGSRGGRPSQCCVLAHRPNDETDDTDETDETPR
jgi:hypothetical protein